MKHLVYLFIISFKCFSVTCGVGIHPIASRLWNARVRTYTVVRCQLPNPSSEKLTLSGTKVRYNTRLVSLRNKQWIINWFPKKTKEDMCHF